MRFSIFATLAILGVAVAAPAPGGGTPTLQQGQDCKSDGSLGNCDKGKGLMCLQIKGEPQGKCQPQK